MLDPPSSVPKPSSSTTTAVTEAENRKRLEPVCNVIATALTTVIGVNAQNAKETDAVLVDAEKEIQECTKAADSIRDMSTNVVETLLPSIEQSGHELDRFFRIIDAIEEQVIPAMNEDLQSLESLISALERQQQPSSTRSWLGLLTSASTDSNEETRSRSRSLPHCELHSSNKLLDIVQHAASSSGGAEEEKCTHRKWTRQSNLFF